MLVTSPVTMARSGEYHFNQTGAVHDVMVDHLELPQEGDDGSALFACRWHPNAGIALHLPPMPPASALPPNHPGPVWGIDSSIDPKAPLFVGPGRELRIMRRSESIYQVVLPEGADLPQSVVRPAPVPTIYYACVGQSLADPYAHHGFRGLAAELSGAPKVLDCAYGGSPIIGTTGNYFWLYPDLSPGPLLTKALNEVVQGKPIAAIIFAHGHANRDELESGAMTIAEYEAAVRAVLEAFGWRDDGTGVPVIIEQTGHIFFGSYGKGFQMLREFYYAFAKAHTDVRLFEAYDAATDDGVHWDLASQRRNGKRAGKLLADMNLEPPHLVSKDGGAGTTTVLTFDRAVRPISFRGMRVFTSLADTSNGLPIKGATWLNERTVEIQHDAMAAEPILRYPFREALDLGEFSGDHQFLLNGFAE